MEYETIKRTVQQVRLAREDGNAPNALRLYRVALDQGMTGNDFAHLTTLADRDFLRAALKAEQDA